MDSSEAQILPQPKMKGGHMDNRGFMLDKDGNLTVDIFNQFGFQDETVIIGDEDHTEAISLSKLSNSNNDSVILWPQKQRKPCYKQS